MTTADYIITIIAILGIIGVAYGLKLRGNKPVDWKGEFIAFMSERKIEVQEISGMPEQWVIKSGLHRYSKINREWLERIRQIEEGKK